MTHHLKLCTNTKSVFFVLSNKCLRVCFRDAFLSKFNVADKLCTERSKVDCSTKSLHRMPSGLCNNLEQPFVGNSHTAFGRLFSANYED